MVALAVRLALIRLVKQAQHATSSAYDLVILDEPFGNVDSPTAKRFLDLLLKDEDRQVLEVGSASRSDLEPSHAATDCTVTVRGQDGVTTVDRQPAG